VEDIYRALSEILLQEEDLQFAALMVRYLNMILLTSGELFDLRHQLKELNTAVSIAEYDDDSDENDSGIFDEYTPELSQSNMLSSKMIG